MNALETTVSMIEKCTEDELQVVQQENRQFFLNRNPQAFTKTQFVEELKLSRRQHLNGRCQEATAALSELRDKYGL